jgi:hypothetical protein
MYLAITSFSKDDRIAREYMREVADALEFQLGAHYAGMWDAVGCKVRVYTEPGSLMGTGEECPLIIFDDPDQADALGWHSVDPYGRAFGRAFWGPIRDAGGTLKEGALSLSATLSHEALEMVGNPYVNFWADIDGVAQEAVELCDRVQGDSYRIGNVSVSNFLGPRSFRDGRGPFDYLDVTKRPFEIRKSGYAIRRSGTRVYPVFGTDFPEWQQKLVTTPTSRMTKRTVMVEQTKERTDS